MITTRVKEVAEAQGLDPAKLSRRADLAYATVYKVWHNQMDDRGVGIVTLQKIAKALGVKVAELLVEDRATLLLATA